MDSKTIDQTTIYPLPNESDTSEKNKQNIKLKIADTIALKNEAYHLIYSKYREKGYIKKNINKSWQTQYDKLKETTTFVAMDKDEVVGAVTIIFDSELNLPGDKLYREEISKLRINNSLAEISALGVKKDTRYSLTICVRLLNQAFLYAKGIKQTSHFIVTVNPRHTSFYLKAFLFYKLGEIKEYDKVGGAPAELLVLDLNHIEKILIERPPFHDKTMLKHCKSIKECKSKKEFKSSESQRWLRKN
ncbi:MAG: hypothetical protein COA79_17915 [Planctomycetota bacterium]|nr:MAG: hypothetical protein COA79_17915 [Planctomycetota bacterium]